MIRASARFLYEKLTKLIVSGERNAASRPLMDDLVDVAVEGAPDEAEVATGNYFPGFRVPELEFFVAFMVLDPALVTHQRFLLQFAQSEREGHEYVAFMGDHDARTSALDPERCVSRKSTVGAYFCEDHGITGDLDGLVSPVKATYKPSPKPF